MFTALHLAGLVADDYVDFGVADLLVPYAAGWKPGPVALGVVSLYLLAVVEGTSLAMRRIPRRVWRGVHLTSYVLFWSATFHFILAGTDAPTRSPAGASTSSPPWSCSSPWCASSAPQPRPAARPSDPGQTIGPRSGNPEEPPCRSSLFGLPPTPSSCTPRSCSCRAARAQCHRAVPRARRPSHPSCFRHLVRAVIVGLAQTSGEARGPGARTDLVGQHTVQGVGSPWAVAVTVGPPP